MNFLLVPFSPASQYNESYKTRKAASLGIPVISEKFVDECILANVVVQHSHFVLQNLSQDASCKEFNEKLPGMFLNFVC